MPGAGHLIHMPSHIYLRIGRYAEASRSNEQAIQVDRAYLKKATPTGIYPMMYASHNFQFLWATASAEGRTSRARASGQSENAIAVSTPKAVAKASGAG